MDMATICLPIMSQVSMYAFVYVYVYIYIYSDMWTDLAGVMPIVGEAQVVVRPQVQAIPRLAVHPGTPQHASDKESMMAIYIYTERNVLEGLVAVLGISLHDGDVGSG